MAINRGCIEVVEETVKNGMDVNCVLKCGWTGLMYAANSANIQIVEYLLSKGANVNSNNDMFNVLMAACSSTISNQADVLSCVTKLINAGADVNSHDRYHMSPLIYAAREGRELVVVKLLDSGANINKQDSRGWSALSWSVSKNHIAVVKILLERGADVKKKHCDGQTAFDLAVTQQYDELIVLLGGKTNTNQTYITATTGDHYMNNDQTENGYVEDSQSVVKYGEVELFLSGLDLNRYVSLFQKQHVEFSTLIRMTDEDLIKMGIHQIGVRKKILDGIRTVHKTEWETTSLPQIQYNKQISCAESVAMVTNISKHCKYIGTTTGYIREQIVKHPQILDVQDGTGPILLLQHTEDAMTNVQTLYTELERLARTLNVQLKRVDYKPPDLIMAKKRTGGLKKRRFIGLVCTVSLVAAVFWKRQLIMDSLSSNT